MRKKFSARAAALGMSGVLLTSALTGCTFGFASDPDDPNAVKEEVPIDMTTDTFQYDTSLSGTSIVIMNTKAEIQTALEEIAKVFEEKAGVHIEIMPVTDGDSPYTKVVSLYNSGNPPTLSILDTTDVIALAEETNRANEAKTEFLSRMAHDIRTPMNAVRGFTRITRENIDDKQAVLDGLDRIDMAGGYLQQIVDDVLDLNRIEKGQLRVHREELGFTHMLQNDVTSIVSLLAGDKLSFTCNVHDSVRDRVIVDSLHLRQIYVNLLSNAVKYTPRGGSIELEAFQEELRGPIACGWCRSCATRALACRLSSCA